MVCGFYADTVKTVNPFFFFFCYCLYICGQKSEDDFGFCYELRPEGIYEQSELRTELQKTV